MTRVEPKAPRRGARAAAWAAAFAALALPAAALVGPGGAVHAFEPQPELADLVEELAVRQQTTNRSLTV